MDPANVGIIAAAVVVCVLIVSMCVFNCVDTWLSNARYEDRFDATTSRLQTVFDDSNLSEDHKKELATEIIRSASFLNT